MGRPPDPASNLIVVNIHRASQPIGAWMTTPAASIIDPAEGHGARRSRVEEDVERRYAPDGSRERIRGRNVSASLEGISACDVTMTSLQESSSSSRVEHPESAWRLPTNSLVLRR